MASDLIQERRRRIEEVIRRYFAACNAADAAGMFACFRPDAVHYFPAGSPFGVFRGADAIARGWIECVARFGSQWTIDDMMIDAETNRAVIEWTHHQPSLKRYVRGAEWYLFDRECRIMELRAYYAPPRRSVSAMNWATILMPHAVTGAPTA